MLSKRAQKFFICKREVKSSIFLKGSSEIKSQKKGGGGEWGSITIIEGGTCLDTKRPKYASNKP